MRSDSDDITIYKLFCVPPRPWQPLTSSTTPRVGGFFKITWVAGWKSADIIGQIMSLGSDGFFTLKSYPKEKIGFQIDSDRIRVLRKSYDDSNHELTDAQVW